MTVCPGWSLDVGAEYTMEVTDVSTRVVHPGVREGSDAVVSVGWHASVNPLHALMMALQRLYECAPPLLFSVYGTELTLVSPATLVALMDAVVTFPRIWSCSVIVAPAGTETRSSKTSVTVAMWEEDTALVSSLLVLHVIVALLTVVLVMVHAGSLESGGNIAPVLGAKPQTSSTVSNVDGVQVSVHKL